MGYLAEVIIVANSLTFSSTYQKLSMIYFADPNAYLKLLIFPLPGNVNLIIL